MSDGGVPVRDDERARCARGAEERRKILVAESGGVGRILRLYARGSARSARVVDPERFSLRIGGGETRERNLE